MELLSFGHVSNNFFTSYSLLFFLVMLHFVLFIILFCNIFHFGVAKQNLKFRLSSLMLFLFIYKKFQTFSDDIMTLEG